MFIKKENKKEKTVKVKTEKEKVTKVYLPLMSPNGKEIKGILRGHEQYSITIETENGNIETYYKHFVSKVNWGKVKFQFNKPKPAPKQEQA